MSVLGKSHPHDSARLHVTGQATYIDDMPPARDEVLLDFVGSPVAHGRILSIELDDARKVPGIVAVWTHEDMFENAFGPVFHDEEVLVEEICRYVGQPIVLLAGTSRAALRMAKKAVKIEVEPLPPILSIDDAIAGEQFIGPTRKIRRGDVAAAFAKAPHRLEGTFVSGGQEHFYLEPQAAVAIPGESGQVTIHSSTQNPSEIQTVVAKALGIRLAQVVCVCKRMGGGFGGKETQAAQPAIFAAWAATKLRRPARIVFGCDQDFAITGKRHPYQARYRVAFDDDGVLTALKTDFYSNGGFSADLSLAVMERTLIHCENAYWIPNVEVTGTVCRTNLPSNTAFRGFGGPQAIAAIENILEDIAAYLGEDAAVIRRRNLYGEGERNTTPYGQVVSNNTLPKLFDKLAATSDYERRRAEVDAFNRCSPTMLRGLSLMPVKFGISFTRRSLNQASALVNVFLDGTIQVSHGGTEMGQGLNVKIQQLVADQFAVPLDAVVVMPTSTEKINNSSPTAASASCDLNGTAAVRAAAAIRQRLAEVAAKHLATFDDGLEAAAVYIEFADGLVFDRRRPAVQLGFTELVVMAYELRVSLGERGFYATPGVEFNRETGKGSPFLYYTNGAAVAEVEIDRFTGDLKVRRVDLLMDLGRSINPAIDRGQVIGGFVQGMGWVTTEDLRYDAKGTLLSHSPTTYKVPAVTDLPEIFNVDFLENPDNTMNVYGSKAVGEPPLLLGVAVFTAVKHALRYAVPGVTDRPGRVVKLDLPATGEEVLRRLTEAIAIAPSPPAKPGGEGGNCEPAETPRTKSINLGAGS